MKLEEGRVDSAGAQCGATALNQNMNGLLPDGLFARMLVVVIACVAFPRFSLSIASDAHRASLLGSFFMLPPLVCGVYFISRSLTQPSP